VQSVSKIPTYVITNVIYVYVSASRGNNGVDHTSDKSSGNAENGVS